MKLYNLYFHNDPVKSLLSASKVVSMYDHKTVRDWLKSAKINETQIVQGELWLKRIQ